jgi:FkbM family methyltransferase
MINRLITLMRRMKAASHLGISFNRSSSFRIPEFIRVNGVQQAIRLPLDENGIRVAFIELLLDDCYGCRRLRKRGGSIKTVLDIGGNVGLFGLAARGTFPNAIIHSYEPNAKLEPFLSTQASVGNFEYCLEAVGSESGTISLDLHTDSVQTRSVESANGNVIRTAFREAIRRMGGEVDFLKMDCEGAEWDIFKDKESWRQVKHLAMEYHLFDEGQTELRVRASVEELGFEILNFRPVDNFGLLIATRRT